MSGGISTEGTWADRTLDPRPAGWFSARQWPSLAVDPASGRPVLFGGFSGGGSLRDEMWAWDAVTATWTDLTPVPRPSSWPPGGGWATIAPDPSCPGKLVAVGSDLLGWGAPAIDTVRVWRWNGGARTWTDLAPSPLAADWPPAGQTPAAALDPGTARIVFFGGQPRAGVPSDETWTWGPAR